VKPNGRRGHGASGPLDEARRAYRRRTLLCGRRPTVSRPVSATAVPRRVPAARSRARDPSKVRSTPASDTRNRPRNGGEGVQIKNHSSGSSARDLGITSIYLQGTTAARSSRRDRLERTNDERKSRASAFEAGWIGPTDCRFRGMKLRQKADLNIRRRLRLRPTEDRGLWENEGLGRPVFGRWVSTPELSMAAHAE